MIETLRNINSIIERDSKDTTYKFALLRGTIDVIQEKSPYSILQGNSAILPLGLLVIKWMEYYYPIIESKLPQKNGDNITQRSITFRSDFEKITNFYSNKGGLSVFIHDLRRGSLSNEIKQLVFNTFKKIRNTVVKQPMRYIGKSVTQSEYSIFQPIKNEYRLGFRQEIDLQYLIERSGFFSIPINYYDVFDSMGSFITGTNSILLNWARFTVEKDQNLNLSNVLEIMLQTPTEARNVLISTKFFSQVNKLECVWSGRLISNDLNIDHVLPYSIWRNNDLWNLLPTKASINRIKSNKIPSIDLLNNSKERIIYYWECIKEKEPLGFERELKVSLVRKMDNWENVAHKSLVEKCEYLVENRGFEVFNL